MVAPTVAERGKLSLPLHLAVAVADGVLCSRRFPAQHLGPVQLFAVGDAGHIARTPLGGIAKAAASWFENRQVSEPRLADLRERSTIRDAEQREVTMPEVRKFAMVLAFSGIAALSAWVPGGGLAADDAGRGGAPTWSYAGPNGPAFWGSLSPDYAICATGRMQSPIDIVEAVPRRVPAPVFDYRSTPLTIVNTGHTVQVNYAPGSTLTVAGKVYELRQFHFHAPAEHALAGMRAAMEVHFVHRSASGALAVLGVTIRVGRRNDALAAVFANMPAEAGPARAVAGAAVDASAMLPPAGAFFQYGGSLTTPPCSEGVLWIVLAEAVEASGEQVAAFLRILGPNARPLQALNERLPTKSR